MTDTTDPTKPVAFRWKFKDASEWGGVDFKTPVESQYRHFDVEPLYSPSLLSEYERVKAENEELSAELEQTNDEFFEVVATIDVDADGNHVERRIPKHHLLQDRLDKATARSEALEAEVKRLREAFELPHDVVESLLAIGPVEWGVSLTQSDEKHASDLLDTLRLTREYFDMPVEETGIHGVYLEGTGTVLAHTGMSPNSSQHARILAGAWNQLVEMARALEASR